MNKDLQDKVWAALPKEIKEEVKRMYKSEYVSDRGYQPTKVMECLAYLFNHGNLTSDAEEEWVNPSELKYKYCIGQKVKSAYADEVLTIKEHCGCVGNDNIYRVEEYDYTWNECELNPYEEPKYKVGDKVRISCTEDGIIWDNILHGRIATVKSAYLGPNDNSIWIYSFEEAIRDLAEAWLKPYTEPKSDHIERRLNIAKDFAAVLLGRLDYNPFMAHINCCSDGKPVNPYRHIASIAVSVADALIAESEEGGEK